jgi:restriction endonuclease S subunit
LLNGLEITEVKLSELNLGDRLDAEYFSKENLLISKRLHKKPTRKIGELGKIAVSAFYPAATHLYAGGDVAFVRCVDCINYPVISHLQDNIFERIPSSFVVEHSSIDTVGKGDLIITKVGSPCYASIVHEHEELALSRTVMGLKEIKGINPYYLLAFLRSHYGFNQLLRQRELTIQYQLTVERVKDVDVFTPTLSFQSQIESIVKAAHQKLEQGKALYTKAERLLLEQLGLPDVELSDVLSYERKFAEVKSANRFDAEYFHPEKQYILEQLGKLEGALIVQHFISVYDIVDPFSASVNEMVQNFDLNAALQFFIDDSESVSISELGSTKKRFKKGDVVVSKLRSYLKEIAIVDTNSEIACVGSSEFIVLRPVDESVCSELLTVYLRSDPVQKILKWCQDGSNHPRFKEEELLSIKLPDRIIAVQHEIKSIVRSAIDTNRESKRLLNIAQRGVEMAIEQDEVTASKWLEQQRQLVS